MSARPRGYVPAANFDWLLWLYDPVLRLTMREQTFKQRLIDEAEIPDRARVLDLGCGTGTLTLMIARRHPESEVHGLDGDLLALARARRKAEREGARIALDEGLSYALPYADTCFDRVLSSLVFHHLSREHKRRTLREVHRVLRPGGSLHIADFGVPSTAAGRAVARVVSRGESIRDNVEGRLPELLREGGFEAVRASRPHGTLFGSLDFLHAQRA